MTDIHQGNTALGDVAARTLANATKTVPMMGTITMWFLHFVASAYPSIQSQSKIVIR